MKDVTRVVLVDPFEESRAALQRLLGGMASLWLSEVLNSYHEAASRVADLAGQVTIVVLDHDPNLAVDLIQKLFQANPAAIIVPASHTADSAIILKAVRAGAREFVTLPADSSELLDIITRLVRGNTHTQTTLSNGPRIISVTGASGGIGCTTVAVNLATSLAVGRDRETILIDLDLLFGSVDACLDISTAHTIWHVLQNFERLDLTLLKRSIPRHSSGLYVLPHPESLHDVASIDAEQLRRFFGLIRAAFDTVIIDTSRGLSSSDFTAFEMSDVIVIVVQLDVICLRNTARLITLLQQFDGLAARVKLVANRAGQFESDISIKTAEETLKMPIAWQIPNAARPFQDARIKGVPLCDVARGSRPHLRFLEIARSLRPITDESESKPRRGLFAAFF